MINAADIINTLLKGKSTHNSLESAAAFAPTNIALVKYWGKRDSALNLPITGSLSITLPSLGATTKIYLAEQDSVSLNGVEQVADSAFAKRLSAYLDNFRFEQNFHYRVETQLNIPVAAGLASSAAGFAALVKALDQLFAWELTEAELSVLARLGSGSACRSLWNGFVEWQVGEQENGLDSHAYRLDIDWPELRVGIVTVSEQEKPISSREAMNRTVATSYLYKKWPAQVAQDLATIKLALEEKNFGLLGTTAENNALLMHATMEDSNPSVVYSTEETNRLRQKIWHCRSQGLPVFFTQDAGPNLKLLFLQRDQEAIETLFGGCPQLILEKPF